MLTYFIGDIMVAEIFKDFDEESHYYFIAKDISEHIDIALDEIEQLDGCFSITGIYVHMNGVYKHENTTISVQFLNESNGKIYSWDFNNDYKLRFKDSIAKVLYWWENKWRDAIRDEMGQCTYFNI